MESIGFLEHVAVHYNYLTIMEVKALQSWARRLPDNPVAVNIGAGAGTSSLALLGSRSDLTLISVDISAKNIVQEELTLEAGDIHASRYEQLCGDSAKFGTYWKRGPIDLVFIDGDHTYNQVKADIKAWLPHIKPGGILCGHDYGFETWPGVKQAFDEESAEFVLMGLVDHLIGFYI